MHRILGTRFSGLPWWSLIACVLLLHQYFFLIPFTLFLLLFIPLIVAKSMTGNAMLFLLGLGLMCESELPYTAPCYFPCRTNIKRKGCHCRHTRWSLETSREVSFSRKICKNQCLVISQRCSSIDLSRIVLTCSGRECSFLFLINLSDPQQLARNDIQVI